MWNRYRRLMRRVNANESSNLEGEISELFENIDNEAGGDDNVEDDEKDKEDENEKKKGKKDEDKLANEDADDEESEEEDEKNDDEREDDDEEEEGEEDEDKDETVKDEKYDALEAKIESLIDIVSSLKESKEEKKEVIADEIDIFETEVYDNLVYDMDWTDKEAKMMKTFLTDFGKQIHNNTINKIMKETPTLINKTMTEQTVIEKTKNAFFNAHPALSKIKPYVAQIASNIAKENKNYSMKQVLNKTAEQIYEIMPALKNKNKTGSKKKKVTEDGKSKKPAFGKTSGARKGAKIASKKSSVVDQIDEMLNID